MTYSGVSFPACGGERHINQLLRSYHMLIIAHFSAFGKQKFIIKTAPRYHRISRSKALIILFQIRTADSISHGKNGTWGNRKLVNSHFDKCIGKGAVRRKLAAYACPYSRFVSGIGSHFYHSQNCGVLGVVKAFKSL